MLVALPKKRYVQTTSKGQVTLPISIRNALSIDTNTLLDVSVENGRVVLEPLKKQPVTDEHWETVVDFTELSPKGITLDDLQRKLKSWTQSKKRSKN